MIICRDMKDMRTCMYCTYVSALIRRYHELEMLRGVGG